MTLQWLEGNSVILRRVHPDQKEYVTPLNPRIVSRSLYSRFLWQYVPAEQWLSKLPQDKLEVVLDYSELCHLFSRRFAPIYRSSLSPTEIAVPLEHIPSRRLSAALSSAISTASQEILGITVFPWAPNIALVWETLKDRILSGVGYRRIADEITLVAFGHSINCRDVFEVGVNLRVLSNQVVSEKFYVIDDREVFMFHPGSPPKNFKLEATRLSGMLVQMYKDTFEDLWNRAIDGSEVICFVNDVKKDYISRCTTGLTQEEKKIVEGLFNYGKFFRSEHVSVQPSRITGLLKCLEERKCVIRFSDSETGFIPNLSPQIREFMETKRSDK